MALFWIKPYMNVQAKITASGRISLPVDMRRRLGLEAGGNVILEESAEGVTIRSTMQAVKRAQALYADAIKGKPDISVDTFLDDRRSYWSRDVK